MRLLLLHLGDPACDPRPARFLEYFRTQGWEIHIASGSCSSKLSVERHIEIPTPAGRARKFLFRTRKAALTVARMLIRERHRRDKINEWLYRLGDLEDALKCLSFDLILVEDLFLLPLAVSIRGEGKIIFDAREFYPSQNEESVMWRLFERPERVRLCRTYLKYCDAVLTVSPGLQKAYQHSFGVTPILLRSMPRSHDLSPRSTRVSEIRMVHHGVANKNRNIKSMIDVVAELDDRFSLDLLLTGKRRNIERLRRACEKSSRTRVVPPVKLSEIIPTISKYDVGFYLLEPRGFNVAFSLPNKLFEFIQARLAIVIGPSPDMANIVGNFECGLVAEDFTLDTMVNRLRELDASVIDNYKLRAHEASQELNFENESKVLSSLLQEFLPGHRP